MGRNCKDERFILIYKGIFWELKMFNNGVVCFLEGKFIVMGGV